MIVKSTKNQSSNLPKDLQGYAFGQDESTTLPLTLEKQYVVSGIRTIDDNRFFLIIPDSGELKAHPWWYPAVLFEVIDESIPEDWVYGGVSGDTFNSFPELANDTTGRFESNLEDGEEQEVSIFLSYYKKYAEAHGLWYTDGKTTEKSQ